MIESIFNGSTVGAELTLSHALLTFAVSILLGVIISFTYMKTQPEYSRSFTLTMIVLPTIVAIIILMIGNNIARAFSLAGAFSIIRFRSAPGDAKDISYVLFSMAAGLACGVGAYGYAALFTLGLCVLMVVLNYLKFGERKSLTKQLKVVVPENLGYEEAFEEVLRQYAVRHELKRVRTTELGSLYEIIYAIDLKPDASHRQLIDDIRCRNGNLDVTLTMNPAAARDY